LFCLLAAATKKEKGICSALLFSTQATSWDNERKGGLLITRANQCYTMSIYLSKPCSSRSSPRHAELRTLPAPHHTCRRKSERPRARLERQRLHTFDRPVASVFWRRVKEWIHVPPLLCSAPLPSSLVVVAV
jgi:hypothetical protein